MDDRTNRLHRSIGIDRNDPQAIVAVGHFVTPTPKELWLQARQKKATLGQFLVELRQHLIKSTYKDELFVEFQKVSQIKDGRTRSITEVAADLKIMQARLPWISDTMMFHQFKHAMEPDLRARVAPFIDPQEKWEYNVRTAERFDAELYAERKETRRTGNTRPTQRNKSKFQQNWRRNDSQRQAHPRPPQSNFNKKPWQKRSTF